MNEIFPITYNYDLIKAKNLTEDRYFKIANKYKMVFEKYVNETLNLSKYNDKMKNGDLPFGVCPIDNQDYYQKNSTLGLDFIYIKNNFNIEVLEVEELNLLENSNDYNILKELIIRTCKKVITINYLNSKKYNGRFKTQCFKDHYSPKTMFYNDSLVIVIREGSTNSNHETIIKKHAFIQNLIFEMRNDFARKLPCNIEICHLLR